MVDQKCENNITRRKIGECGLQFPEKSLPSDGQLAMSGKLGPQGKRKVSGTVERDALED
jgi:hypothetical protein